MPPRRLTTEAPTRPTTAEELAQAMANSMTRGVMITGITGMGLTRPVQTATQIARSAIEFETRDGGQMAHTLLDFKLREQPSPDFERISQAVARAQEAARFR